MIRYADPCPAIDVWPRVAAAGSERWLERLDGWWSWLTASGVRVHDGDLVTARLSVGPEPLVVTGNVRLSGLLEDGHRADNTLLVVLGDLDAEHVATHSAIFVAGHVRIRGVLYGNSSGDDLFCVAGDCSVGTVVEHGHHVEVHGTADVDVLVGRLTTAERPRHVRQPHEALVNGAYEVHVRQYGRVIESSVDGRALLTRLRGGKPLLADVRRSPAEKVVAEAHDRSADGRPVRRLTLESMELSTLPERLFELASLERLVLDNNPLTAIPSAIGQLRALRSLDLENLPITSLATELGQLPALTTLSLRYCKQLNGLPDSFADLTALEQLYLDGAVLAGGFPEVLTRLPRLKKLWWWRVFTPKLPDDGLRTLIDGLGRMPALTQTGFFQSRINALPRDLTPLTRLRRVWISDDVTMPARQLQRLHEAMPPGRVRQGHPG